VLVLVAVEKLGPVVCGQGVFASCCRRCCFICCRSWVLCLCLGLDGAGYGWKCRCLCPGLAPWGRFGWGRIGGLALCGAGVLDAGWRFGRGCFYVFSLGWGRLGPCVGFECCFTNGLSWFRGWVGGKNSCWGFS
jgi:hypothetical protein